ncbi:MAG: T9SS type A sorting domain-containing protein [Bacteroidia bacterium]
MIDVSPADRHTWTDFKTTFCADDDYWQLWIFPSGPYVLLLDEITIEYEECDPSVVFNSLIPAFYQTDETITTTSNAFNNPNQVTELKAENFILMENMTLITAVSSPSNYFLAEIVPCEVRHCNGGSSLNGGGKAREGISTMNAEGTELSVYPNPASTSFRIHIEQPDYFNQTEGLASNVSLKVTDNLGRLVYQKEGFNLADNVNTSNLLNGIYLVTVQVDGRIFTQRVLIQH